MNRTVRLPPSSATINDGGSANLRIVLTKDEPDQVIQQVDVRVVGSPARPFGELIEAPSGPLWAELFLERGNGSLARLDDGYIRAGGLRGLASMVGAVGSIAYDEGDTLLARVWNDSGFTATVTLEASAGRGNPTGYTHISTIKYALWVYHVRIVNDALNAGNHTITVTPSLGDDFRLLMVQVFNGDAVARAVLVESLIAAGSLRPPRYMSNVGIAAGQIRAFPIAVSGDGNGIAPPEPMPIPPDLGGATNGLITQLSGVSVSEDSEHFIMAWIRGRKPSVTVSIPQGASVTVNVNRLE